MEFEVPSPVKTCAKLNSENGSLKFVFHSPRIKDWSKF